MAKKVKIRVVTNLVVYADDDMSKSDIVNAINVSITENTDKVIIKESSTLISIISGIFRFLFSLTD